ncbi:MAG: LacI family DNA-binding transcriptional regulator, partial [Clostridium sp.]|uniref:LacI family DNA-binding transcriptional regulator n=1 Tax=Clostridium sp. TaxID=1506 RepID=UPI003EE68D93
VLNNSEEVSENTRKNILDIMKEYNYIPNNSARNLKIIKSNTIGILVDSGYNPFFYELINIINGDLLEKGFHMVTQFMDSRKDDLESIQEFIKEKRLDGLICIGINFIKANEEVIKNIKTPIVAISSYVSEGAKEYISSVNINDFKESYKAVKFLIDKGHREIGIIGSIEKDDSCGNERLRAYKKAQEEAKIRGKKIFIEFGDYTFESGYNAGKKLISKKKMPTAIFAISDIMAVGAAKAFQDIGLEIPKDISIIGFDGIPYTKYYNPAITTVKQPFEYMAKESVNLIYEMVNENGKHKHINFEAEVLERESVKNLV